MITNNYFNGDPLLDGNSVIDSSIREYQAAIAKLQEQKRQYGQQVSQLQQPQQSATPVWDEIDSVTSSMSDKEFAIMAANEEFISSQNAVMAILQKQYMKVMRPLVEGCQEGKDALERHLTLVNRLRKSAKAEADKEISDFNEYREKYSHMSYDDYLEMKKGEAK